MRYAKSGWMFIDVIGTIPFPSFAKNSTFVRLIRLLRLPRILRIHNVQALKNFFAKIPFRGTRAKKIEG